MNDCTLCSFDYETKPFYETKNFYIKHGPLNSQILGYLHLIPKRHIESLSEMNENELNEFPYIIKKLEELLVKHVAAERVYIVTISESVRHLHFHLIPRSSNNQTRGLNLIEQATLQKVKACHSISMENINTLQDLLIEKLSHYYK
ncbi:HIT family protein [Priestia aryabhattai]|uniref:HIT family protein n=1 Tax=Priestia aryabhattai TaxID=412384 RepID=UPI00068E8B27|nr:HIT family protein [Priestia aryabhattai]